MSRNSKTKPQAGEGRRMSKGEESTRRWLPTDDQVTSFVDGILDKVEKIDNERSEQQPALFNAKITCSLVNSRKQSRDLRGIVSQAFLSMFNGMPEDHVVINPEANSEFLSRCRLLGAEVPDFKLNRTLLNVRKAGWHAGIDRGSGKSLTREAIDQIGYAAEISARFVQLQAIEAGMSEPSIDNMLCDPTHRKDFDDAAQSVSPGFSVYHYRLAALAFRKIGRHNTRKLGFQDMPQWDNSDIPLRSIDPDDVPEEPGIYCVSSGSKALFVSATLNLRGRTLSHVAVDGGKSILPETLFDPPRKELKIKFFKRPCSWRAHTADAVAAKMKSDRKAKFNLFSAAV